MANEERRQETRLVESGRRKQWRGRTVNPPVRRGSTVLFDSTAEMNAAKPGLGRHYYGLHGNETHWALMEALTEIEPGAAGTMLYPSGLAAIAAALLSVLASGDELLVPDNAYRPTRGLCDRLLRRLGITTRYYDPLVGTEIVDLISTETRAILLESPGSLTMEVQDVPGICTVARERGLTTLLDNTWATPIYFEAIAAGVDLTIMAVTKYVGGHADLLMGAVTANEDHYPALEQASWHLGQTTSPDDCFLALRGLRTMAARLERHQSSALEVARWLKEQPQVAQVLHPAFPDCPGHDHWKRDFKGSTGLFSFVLDGGSKADRDALLDRLELFGLGYSWGGFESLAAPADTDGLRTVTRTAFEGPLVRLHIGLEDPGDLMADLQRALADYRCER